MKRKFIEDLEKLDFTLPETKPMILGIIEEMYNMIEALKKEVQELKDEINHLKGQKGKPDIKPNKNNLNTKPKMEKGEPKVWKKKPKNIKVDREQIITIDPTILPDDAVFKGYNEKIVQNIIMTTDNVLIKREVFYSASENKTYIASLDKSLENTSFGPELKAQILRLYFECRMTENLIHSFLTNVGISISEGQISNIIIKEKKEKFNEEKIEILTTGLANSTTGNLDDSGFREDGTNKYISIICNALFSCFIVNDNKNAKTVEKMFKDIEIDFKEKAITCDDAPQFKILLTLGIIIQLCWVHEERHYEKLNPVLKTHKEELKLKISEIWDFYRQLKEYQKHPNEKTKQVLGNLFDDIFNVTSNYKALNDRLKLTYKKKEELLAVLSYPNVDIHNNRSENGIRPVPIKIKISNGTRTDEGTASWENHLSILSTCKKHGINYYEYILDIFKCQSHKKSLATLIVEKANA